MIVGPEPAWRRGWGGDASERLFFHPHVGMDVDLGGLDVFVTKPERDHRLIDAVVKQVHRRAVAQRMWRDPLGADARARARRREAMLADQMLKSVTAQPFAPDRREQRLVRIFVVADPRCQQLGCLAAKRGGALLPALTVPNTTSPRVRPTSSEARRPVWIASSSRA